MNNKASRRVKPAVSWPGGKSRLLKEILPLIPRHNCYVEPFCGGLAVMLAKTPSRVEVLNDINQELINFYRCVRFHSDVLLTELEFVLNSRQEFHDFRHQPGLTDIQRSARWYFRNKTCFGGASLESFGISPASGMNSRSNRMEAIRALNLRLDQTTIENLPWEKCLELYDRAETFFFVDPPHTECSATMYDPWTNTDVQNLANRLGRLKGRWMVTLNDTKPIREIFSGCKIKAVERANGINNRTQVNKTYRELVIIP